MGQRGPKPLPKNVHLLRGNPGKRPLDGLASSVEPDIEIPGLPKHLLPEARRFWGVITPELEALGLIAKIDLPSISLVCQEWAWLVWHEQALQRDIKRAKKREGEARKKWLDEGKSADDFTYDDGDGFMLPTPNGSFTYNPHWVARNKHAAALDKFLASFGMSPSSRGRVTPSSRQLNLPGVPDPGAGFNAF